MTVMAVMAVMTVMTAVWRGRIAVGRFFTHHEEGTRETARPRSAVREGVRMGRRHRAVRRIASQQTTESNHRRNHRRGNEGVRMGLFDVERYEGSPLNKQLRATTIVETIAGGVRACGWGSSTSRRPTSSRSVSNDVSHKELVS